VDEIDKQILRVLMARSDLPIAILADNLGLSRMGCRKRIKRMEADGIIQGRSLIVNARAVGFGVSIFAQIRLASQDERSISSFEEKACDCDEIVECFSMSQKGEYLLKIVAKSVADYDSFIRKILLEIPELASINSNFALREIKITAALPI
jgi:Lrp/AsnC family transcriptional regulator, cysteine-sensing transcriptional activator